ncbi:MAG: hypothetical protein Q8M19_14045 [Reyranella sp.]|nr:hypothetical protein [Reyranella sp.]
MFKFERFPTFNWPVHVQVPTDGGKFTEQVFTVRWQLQNSDELRKAQTADGADGTKVLFERALKGWSTDLCDEAGHPIPFTAENVELVRTAPHVRAAMVTSYWDAVNGGLRAKN